MKNQIKLSFLIILLLSMNGTLYALQNSIYLNPGFFIDVNPPFPGITGIIVGDIIDEEKKLIKNSNENDSINFLSYNIGIDYNVYYAFDNFSIGIKALLGVNYLFEDTQINGKSYGGSFNSVLLDYQYSMIGPVVQIPLTSNNNYQNNIYLNLFCYYGYIFNGKLNAAPALRDAGYSYPNYKSNFDGTKCNAGLGIVVPNNGLNINVNLIYSKSWIDLEETPSFYSNVDKKTNLQEITIEIRCEIKIPLDKFH